MKRIKSSLVLLLCGSLWMAAVDPAKPVAATSQRLPAHPEVPTFSSVGPILLRSCVGCHRPGGIASQADFTSYQSVRPWAKAIKEMVQTRQMPPWSADLRKSLKFSNDARLTESAIATLAAWADAGAPLGKGSNNLAVPELAGGWEHPQGRKPDLVLSGDRDMQIPAAGMIPYVRILVKLPLMQDRWISASQVRPGDASVVHHMAITEVQLNEGVTPSDIYSIDAMTQRMGGLGDNNVLHRVIMDASNHSVFDMLGMYTPGSGLETYPEDSGKLLKGGENLYLNFNMHYAPNGKATLDRTQVAFWFRDSPPKHQILRVPMAYETVLAEGTELLTDRPGIRAEGTQVVVPPIPPGVDAYELQSVTAFTRSAIIYQLQPHAHLRGKDFEYVAFYPDGREQILLSVPHYDFRWQLAYDLATPLKLPAGSKLVVTGHFDNSANNPFNPAPGKPVFFRAMNMSTDEMFSPFVQYALGEDTDLPVVETAGCLVSGVKRGDWSLLHAAHGTPATQSTSSAAVRAAASIPARNERYRLIGVAPFRPGRHDHERVVVRGVLIGGTENRMNVTSLQSIAGEPCVP